MMRSSRANQVIEAQKEKILELCKAAYPDGVRVCEIYFHTNFKLNKIPIDELISEGKVEYDGEYVRLNG